MLLATDCFLTHVITSYLPNLASSIIILVPQLISLFQPFYPFGDRLYAAKLIHSEYSKLALDAEKNINQYLYGSKNIQDFAKLAVSFQKSLSSVEEEDAVDSFSLVEEEVESLVLVPVSELVPVR